MARGVRTPCGSKLAAATRRHGELPAVVEGPYSIFIGSALRARRFAESQTDTPAVQRKRKQQREQQERSDLLALAEKMEDVVRHHQSCRKAQHPQRVPSPTGPLPDLPQEAEAKRSLEWLGREAQQAPSTCREECPRTSRAELGLGSNPRPRQQAEWWKGKAQSVTRTGCVHAGRWSTACTEWCGKPRYDAVAAMTNIAFPDADVVGENVRSACKATTRTARRKRCTQPPK